MLQSETPFDRFWKSPYKWSMSELPSPRGTVALSERVAAGGRFPGLNPGLLSDSLCFGAEDRPIGRNLCAYGYSLG
jgi:hypothetical protein